MRVVVCPDKFAGTLTAAEAAAAIVEGWRSVCPDDELVALPLSDGGPGFLDAVQAAIGGQRWSVPCRDPLGRPVRGEVLTLAGTAYVESAQACGLHLLAASERDPKATTSYGLGQLLVAAIEAGVSRIVIGLGGSATNDGGAGMLAALDAYPLDVAGYALPYGGAALIGCASLGGAARLRGVQLVAATDVDNPLTGPAGASAVFAPQKGATASDVPLLDAALARFAAVVERDLPGCPAGLAARAGAGAAGGIGAAIMALGGRRESGAGLVAELSRLGEILDTAELAITGEGSFDPQSDRGKVVAGVATAARARGVACVVLAGRVSTEWAGVRAYSLERHFGGVEQAMRRPAEGLRALAARLAGDHGVGAHRPGDPAHRR